MRKFLFVGVVLLGACLLAYGGALDNPLLYDDEVYIKNNPNLEISRLTSLVKTDYYDDYNFFPPPGVLSYRPVSTFLYVVNRSLWGERYEGWRLTYLLLHAVNGLLLFWILFRRRRSFQPAALTALLFVLHPVHSEVINQISYDEDVVMTTLLLAASCVLLNWRQSRRRSWMLLASALFFLALLTKENALFFLPVLIIFVLAVPSPTDREARLPREDRNLLLLASFTAGCYLFIRFGPMQSPVESEAMGNLSFGVVEYCAEVFRLLWVYFTRFLWPLDLSAVYRFPPASWGSPSVLLGAGLLAALLGAVAVGIARRRPFLAVPAAWYLAGLSTILYAVMSKSYTLAWDHYIYCASIGLLMYAFFGVEYVLDRVPAGTRRNATTACLAAAICALCLPLVWERNLAWSSNLALWNDASRKAPLSQVAHYNLGYTHWEEGNLEEAAEEYLLAAELDPDYFMAQVNLGLLYYQVEKLGLAEERFRKALAIMPENERALVSLGYILMRTERLSEAEDTFRKALRGNPGSRELKRHLGDVLRLQSAPASGESRPAE